MVFHLKAFPLLIPTLLLIFAGLASSEKLDGLLLPRAGTLALDAVPIGSGSLGIRDQPKMVCVNGTEICGPDSVQCCPPDTTCQKEKLKPTFKSSCSQTRRAWCCPKDALICGLEGLAATDCCDASIGEHCCGDICCARNQECQFDGVEFGCSTTEDEAGEAESASSTNDGKAMMLATVGSYGFTYLSDSVLATERLDGLLESHSRPATPADSGSRYPLSARQMKTECANGTVSCTESPFYCCPTGHTCLLPQFRTGDKKQPYCCSPAAQSCGPDGTDCCEPEREKCCGPICCELNKFCNPNAVPYCFDSELEALEAGGLSGSGALDRNTKMAWVAIGMIATVGWIMQGL
ncbi:hypothetical protein CC2G_009492 [Coprinopsis cinerea AmutBmut pab1-1]|nr:hypothetical protein CC2G_009492 [Coprinopsis cinerea AmutBmut pab1-1]